MAYSNRDDRSGGGGKSFGKKSYGKPSFGARDGGGKNSYDRGERPAMHKAICDECGNSCEVPFKPNGDKPVYCNNCFRKENNAGESLRGGRDERTSRDRDFGDRSYGRDRDSDDRGFGRDARPAMHKATCSDCGNTCEVPFKPSHDKPVYCTDCFGKGPKGGGNKGNDQMKEQFEMLNAKLDMLLKALTPAAAVKAPKEKVVVAEKAAEAEVVAVKKEKKGKEVKEEKPKKAVKKAAKK